MQLLLPQILLTEKKLLWSPPIISCYSVETHRYFCNLLSLLNSSSCTIWWRIELVDQTQSTCINIPMRYGQLNYRNFRCPGFLFSLCNYSEFTVCTVNFRIHRYSLKVYAIILGGQTYNWGVELRAFVYRSVFDDISAELWVSEGWWGRRVNQCQMRERLQRRVMSAKSRTALYSFSKTRLPD